MHTSWIKENWNSVRAFSTEMIQTVVSTASACCRRVASYRSWMGHACTVLLLLALLSYSNLEPVTSAKPRQVYQQVKHIWQEPQPINHTVVEHLRQDAWNMFDRGFTNYMELAFPMDNLRPISCTGSDWQGGIALTLLDSLDSLLLMGRLGDMRAVLPLISQHVKFDKDIKVHVFEVVIRALGGLLSGHVLLERAPELLPEYDGLLLRLANQLAERLMPAFDSPTGLPWLHTNLQKGPVNETRVTCTACAGTLLLEYGTLSALQGDAKWRQIAEHTANLLYARRSALGLVGSSINVATSSWVSKETTIGPGIDSFYEYLIKAYLMFGNHDYLEKFADLYVSAMTHMQVPVPATGYEFLADVHMDSGRVTQPYVSSLGAFWPGMQALIGQQQHAQDLHSNFTAAWEMWGLLPEVFKLDLSRIHPEDPGYNLRPEHIESTFMLYALTGHSQYQQLAARIQRTLQATTSTECGYASVSSVETGIQNDLQESFFLSETLKYTYLIFSPGAEHILDYYVLTTEGHLLPAFPPEDSTVARQEVAQYNKILEEDAYDNCASLCELMDDEDQSEIEQQLRTSFPLLSFRRQDAKIIRRRRCIACSVITQRMAQQPKQKINMREKIKMLTASLQPPSENATSSIHGTSSLSQVVCLLAVSRNSPLTCSNLRPLTQHDLLQGLPQNALILQLSWLEATNMTGLLLIAPEQGSDTSQQASLILPTGTAAFGNTLKEMTKSCMRHLYNYTTEYDSKAPVRPSQQTTAGPEKRCSTPPKQNAKPPRKGVQGQPASQSDSHSCGCKRRTHSASYSYQSIPLTLQQQLQPWQSLIDQVRIAQRQLHFCPRDQSEQDIEAILNETKQLIEEAAHSSKGQGSSKQQAEHSHMSACAGGKTNSNIVSHTGSNSLSDNHMEEPAFEWDPGSTDCNKDMDSQQGMHDRQVQGCDDKHGSRQSSSGTACEQEIAENPVLGNTQSTQQSEPGPGRYATGPCKKVRTTHGKLVLAEPIHGCKPVANADAIAGTIAVVVRGGCSFATKANFVQSAGAIGMVVLNLYGDEIVIMSEDDVSSPIMIPAQILGAFHSRLLLKALLQQQTATLTAVMAHNRPGLHEFESVAVSNNSTRQSGSKANTRVDLLVPNSSYMFVHANLLSMGYDLNAVLAELMTDDRIILFLTQVALEHQAELAEKRLHAK